MLVSIDTSQGDESLTHQGLLYRSQEEFLAGTVPFVRAGLEHGDPIWVVTTVRNAGWLRVALGGDARRVVFGDCSQWYLHPGRALAALYRAVSVAADGKRLRMIGEPLWTARIGQEGSERARYESLVNVALASANASCVCAYDTRVMNSKVVAQVARTHPELVVDGGARPSPSYTDPAVFNAECDKSPLPEPPPTALRLPFDRLGQLASLRGFMTSYATWAGAVPHSVRRFVQALDEVATNAIEHGDGSRVVRIWTRPRSMVCEVSDTGAGRCDPMAGHLPPRPGRAGGCGLWLARQFCDLVEMRSDATGTVVRLHLYLP
ncbi:MAG TPA: sensor histidine kinase [Pseudonocardiaceae bacterium]|nr:sensor histidine kinase [Pseudonocardiaceae bacterium]